MKSPMFTYTFDDYFDQWCYDEPDQREFEGCCGANITSNFPEDICYTDYLNTWQSRYSEYKEDHDNPRKASPGTEAQFIKAFVKSYDLLLNDVNKLSIVILNQHQKVFFPVLEKAGYKIVSDTFINPSTRNKLYVFVYTPKNKRKSR